MEMGGGGGGGRVPCILKNPVHTCMYMYTYVQCGYINIIMVGESCMQFNRQTRSSAC